jgi:hypothetical protein
MTGHAGKTVRRFLGLIHGWLALSLLLATSSADAAKEESTLYPPSILQRVRANVERSDWGQKCRDAAIGAAQPWLDMPDDQLWDLMFGPGITRSWMVWSNGHCPACQESVPMYNWRIDALGNPWKVCCPHCQEYFPKNDFQAYYRSGLNGQGDKGANR